MRKNIIMLASLVVMFGMALSSVVFASYEDSNTGLYIFNSKIIGFWISYDDSGDNWTEIYNDSTGATIDIAQGDAGPQMGTFFSGKSVPAGTVKRVKVRISWDTTIKGWVKSGSSYYVTDSAAIGTYTSLYGGAGVPSESDCDEISMPVPEGQGDYMEQTQSISITVSAGQAVNVSVLFDLSNALTVEDFGGQYVIHPNDSFQPTIQQI